jgi:hypothetical protein
LFGPESRFRLFLIKTCRADWFNNAIMLMILLNSISIALYDNSLENKALNDAMQIASFVFCLFYTLEAVMHIIAKGFLFGQNTYLRSPANIFDFTIVIISLLEFFLQLFAEG